MRRFPFGGCFLVARRYLRGSSIWQEAVWAAVCLGAVTLSANAIQKAWFGDLDSAGDRAAVLLTRWMVASLVAMVVVLPIFGAIMAPAAIPAQHELEATQAEVLAGLSGSTIVLGRLLACLRPLLLIILMSIVLWSAIEVSYHPLAYGSWLNVVQAHLVVLAALCTVSAVAVLVSSKRSGGRSWWRGTFGGMLVFMTGVLALFTLNGWLASAQNPVPVIQRILVFNPVTAVCTSLNFDLLRVNWIYGRTIAPEFDFRYPGVWKTTSALFLLCALAVTVAGLRVDRALRR